MMMNIKYQREEEEKTNEVYKVDRWGIVQIDTASTYSQVRPVIYLNSKAMFKSGRGTEKSPYKVK